MVAVRVTADLEPMIDLFARAGAETAALLQRLGVDAAEAHGPAPAAVG